MRRSWKALGMLLASLLLTAWLTGQVHSQNRKVPIEELPLPKQVAHEVEVEEEVAKKFLDALGPILQRQLAAGKQVTLPGLGAFRVVRIPPHRDLVGGRPVVIPGRNYVEFLPDANMVQSANDSRAKPAQVVQPFRYNPLPNQTPSRTVPRVRTPSTRIR